MKSAREAGERLSLRDDLTVLRRFVVFAKPYWGHIVGLFGISLASTPLALLEPIPLKIVIDNVVGSNPLPGWVQAAMLGSAPESLLGKLLLATGLLLALKLVSQLVSMSTSILHAVTTNELVLRFRTKLFRHVQRLSFSYHDRHGTTDSVYRIQYDATSISSIAIDGVMPFVTSAIMLIAMVYVTMLLDWQLALVALIVLPPLAFIARARRITLRPQYGAVKKLESSALKTMQETLSALRVVKAFGQQDREHQKFWSKSNEGVKAKTGLAVAEGKYNLMVGLVTALGTAAVLFVGVQHIQDGTLTLGSLLVVMAYISKLYAPITAMGKKTASLQGNLVGAERALALLDEAPDVEERDGARHLDRAAGQIEFESVNFGYDPTHPVIHDVSFSVPVAARVGIAGHTGAGKSTLLGLLMRFYDPGSGRILLDGQDLRDLKVDDLRAQFSVVQQDVILFSTTVAENIAYGRPDANEDEVIEAAKAARAHDFIVGLPQGYETVVGERGMTVSGGERQRISLARAFLRDAPILILDEPTSAVDVKTESLIMETMERLMEGRTTIMIAHRLSTLENCDVRLSLDGGRLREEFTRPAAVGLDDHA